MAEPSVEHPTALVVSLPVGFSVEVHENVAQRDLTNFVGLWKLKIRSFGSYQYNNSSMH
jgi:hypothetical protein